MKIKMGVKFNLAPKNPSVMAGRIYGIFGMEPEQGERVYVESFEIDVSAQEIVLFSGMSGGGKTTCLKQFLAQTGGVLINDITYDQNKMLIEQLGSDERQATEIASYVGLAEAQLFLRYPQELSDGQRYRFILAKAIAEGHKIIGADEYCATLDRVTAKTISFNLRKIVDRYGLIFAAATTHSDIIEDLQPNYFVDFKGGCAEVTKGEIIKKKSHFTRICTLRAGLREIGNTLKNGIIADIPSES